jgi:hypothetical protein
MSWTGYFHPKFKAEFDELSMVVQDELLASLVPLREYGPSLGGPEVDTLNDSKYPNMKELRSGLTEAFGALPLLSIRSETRFCWSRETNPE